MSSKKDRFDLTLVYTSNLFFPHFGGVENSLFYLAKASQELGFSALVVASNIKKKPSEELPTREILDGVSVERYPFDSASKLLRSVNNIRSCYTFYRKMVKQNPDLLFVCRYHFNQLMVSLAGGKSSIYLVPGIIKNQNHPSRIPNADWKYKLKWYYHRLLQKWAFARTKHIAVFSENMKRQVEELGIKRQIHITKPGVNLERFSVLSEDEKYQERRQLDPNLTDDSVVFLCLGRCVTVKGFHLAVKAMEATPKHYKLWIVGDGDELASLKRCADEIGVSDRITFWGASHETEKFYRCADYFILSSLYEPLGQTLLEAMASGLPVIAFEPSPSTGVETASRDLMTDAQCYFVDAPEPSQLAEVMRRLEQVSAVEYQQRAQAIRSYIEANFAWTNLVHDLLAIADGGQVTR